jgi:hypothetical protein
VIGREALRGIVLEEVLARLLQDNGYKLLVSEHQDPDALKQDKHGLLVRGRGGEHQADVIGEFDLPVPFSLPLRLFVEAKFTKQKVGIAVVRNAHGTIHDVNEQYSPFSSGESSVPVRRYQYRYTLFSASGFAPEAQRYALAQQISLVDLSGSGFAELRALVSDIADATRDLAFTREINRFPVWQARAALRRALGTWTGGIDTLAESAGMDVHQAEEMSSKATPGKKSSQMLPHGQLMTIVRNMHSDQLGDLIVGFPSAPFILVMRIESRADFETYLARHPGSEINVHIEFADRGKHDGDWVVVPTDGSTQFRLVFALPELLAEWLLDSDGPAAPRVRDIKRDMLSSIVVFQDNRLLRLLYQPHRLR